MIPNSSVTISLLWGEWGLEQHCFILTLFDMSELARREEITHGTLLIFQQFIRGRPLLTLHFHFDDFQYTNVRFMA